MEKKIKLLKGNIFIIKNTIQTGEMGRSLKHFLRKPEDWGLEFTEPMYMQSRCGRQPVCNSSL